MKTTPTCGVLAGEPEIIGTRCMDGGKCHHGCVTACFRKECCAPLTLSGLTYEWELPVVDDNEFDRVGFEKYLTGTLKIPVARDEDGAYLAPDARTSWHVWKYAHSDLQSLSTAAHRLGYGLVSIVQGK